MTTPRLQTARLLMREWRDSDRAPYAELNADPDVMRHFPSTLTSQQSDEMIERMIAHWDNRGFGLWAVERTDTSAFIGFVGLMMPVWQAPFTPCVEVGWRLAQQHWGNGFAPEAATAALEWGFANVELPADEIVSFTTEGNVSSRRVMEKIGMERDPHDDFDHPMLPDWAERRHVLYRIDRRQFTEHVAR
ncbi:MAG TPA: GNAT family N-acetyltransferase [Ilumatobacteraceae bacterium]|nr:GNAT family N-acetyltransferase [Ilumatobacteraceae bacterium]